MSSKMNSSPQIYSKHCAWVIHICEYTMNLIIQYNRLIIFMHSLIHTLQF